MDFRTQSFALLCVFLREFLFSNLRTLQHSVWKLSEMSHFFKTNIFYSFLFVFLEKKIEF